MPLKYFLTIVFMAATTVLFAQQMLRAKLLLQMLRVQPSQYLIQLSRMPTKQQSLYVLGVVMRDLLLDMKEMKLRKHLIK
jgi:hypothetical protein